MPEGLSSILDELARLPEGARGSAWDEVLRPGAIVGRFELLSELGRGGFGQVWEARDTELGRGVAFKAVRASTDRGTVDEQLLREAEAAARLSHPNIVTLYDVGRCEAGPYLVLELLRGQTLSARLGQGELGIAEALRIAHAVAEGLACAHRQGVVHRDLTPGNVFLCPDGQVKVLDFGLAHAFGRRRVDGGTPAYMAPEQWRGAPEDERTDVFALGVMLYRLLSGRLPFPEGDRGKAASRVRAPPALEVPGVPAVGTLIARMLSKDPVHRPRDAGDVAAALAAFRGELERTPPAPGGPVRAHRRLARWWPVALALLLVAGLALGLAYRRGVAPPRELAAVPSERITVAVADFVNQTGDPELSGLSGMLITSLEQSRRLAVLTRVRMLDLLRQLGKESAGGVDEPLGREVARSAGARALVLATIHRFDQLYAIELKALDPDTSEYLFTLKEEGRGKASVPGMIDRLSERTRTLLRETPAEVKASRVQVAAATTGSFEAYSAYFHGEQAMDATRYEEALAGFRRAIAADPSFSLAHYQIAYLGEFTGLDAATRKAEIEEALRDAQRAPEKERLLIRAWKAHMDGRNEEAHGLYAQAVAAYPQDKDALYMAADLYFHEGRTEEALPLFERALALDPTWEPALLHLMDSLFSMGRGAELEARSRRWVEQAPASAAAWRARAQGAEAAGRMEDAVADDRRALELDGGHHSRAALADALALAERYPEAEALVRPSAERGQGLERIKGLYLLANQLSYQGRLREAQRALDGLPRELPMTPEHSAQRLAFLLGDRSQDAARAEALRLWKAPKPHWGGLPLALELSGAAEEAKAAAAELPPGEGRQLFDAAAAWRRGERAAALGSVRALAERPSLDVRGPALWLLGEWALASGRDAEAAAALERFRRVPGGVARSWMYPRSFYLEALARERLGERHGAREAADHLLRLWARADADAPYLAEVKALRRRLGPQEPAR